MGEPDYRAMVGKYVCSRSGCGAVSEVATEMGVFCLEHSRRLLFPIQKPMGIGKSAADRGAPDFIPWEMIRPHERQALTNHGGQSLARLAERGGLSVSEAVAVLEDRSWDRAVAADRVAGVARLNQLLREWIEGPISLRK